MASVPVTLVSLSSPELDIIEIEQHANHSAPGNGDKHGQQQPKGNPPAALDADKEHECVNGQGEDQLGEEGELESAGVGPAQEGKGEEMDGELENRVESALNPNAASS